MKKLIALIMLAIGVVPGAGGATTNTLVDHTDTAPAWHSYLIELDGSPASFEIAGTVVRFPSHVGMNFLDANGRLIFGLTNTALGPTNGVLVDAFGIEIIDDRSPAFGGAYGAGPGVALHVNQGGAQYVGRFNLLFWSSGDLKGSRHRITAGGSSTLIATDQGDEAYLFTSADFRNGVTVVAGDSTDVGFATSAHANVLTSRALRVNDTFIGLFIAAFASPVPGAPAGFPMSTNVMSAETPDGHRDCPCVMPSFTGNDFGPPARAGDYRFDLTSIGFVGGGGEIILAGADARLPSDSGR